MTQMLLLARRYKIPILSPIFCIFVVVVKIEGCVCPHTPVVITTHTHMTSTSVQCHDKLGCIASCVYYVTGYAALFSFADNLIVYLVILLTIHKKIFCCIHSTNYFCFVHGLF